MRIGIPFLCGVSRRADWYDAQGHEFADPGINGRLGHHIVHANICIDGVELTGADVEAHN